MSNLNYLRDHSPFSSTQELNEVVGEHIARNKYNLNPTDRDVLMMLSRYAVKYSGVAHLKVATIAKAINKSAITARRALNKLARLSIIEKRSFFRDVTGGNGANLYVFLAVNDRAEMIEREEVEELAAASEQGDSSENEPIQFISAREVSKDVLEPLDRADDRPYVRFKNAVATFIGSDKRLLYRLYGVYLSQTKALRNAYHANELIDVAIRGINATFKASKSRSIRNIAGYFNGVISNMLDDLCTELMGELFAGAGECETVM